MYLMLFDAQGRPVINPELAEAVGKALGLGDSDNKTQGLGIWNVPERVLDREGVQGVDHLQALAAMADEFGALKTEQE